MALLEEVSNVEVKPAVKSDILKLWKVAGILLLITVLEFICAFTMPRGVLLIAIFVGMTFIKAFYIVGEFMHLKHETKVLIWSLGLPLIFVVWLLIALIYEGGAILDVR